MSCGCRRETDIKVRNKKKNPKKQKRGNIAFLRGSETITFRDNVLQKKRRRGKRNTQGRAKISFCIFSLASIRSSTHSEPWGGEGHSFPLSLVRLYYVLEARDLHSDLVALNIYFSPHDCYCSSDAEAALNFDWPPRRRMTFHGKITFDFGSSNIFRSLFYMFRLFFNSIFLVL